MHSKVARPLRPLLQIHLRAPKFLEELRTLAHVRFRVPMGKRQTMSENVAIIFRKGAAERMDHGNSDAQREKVLTRYVNGAAR